ncbi:Spy0128 family protein [uncultured Parolsenella sp.]|uniref:Spy0128 family protein n=1 Tax=uncultured Parolsenella sp. TaxID=2083008 RepID=UPI0027D9A80D|nr:FctA domain-containing protein [uncultured Parolsenella sp.]
MKIKTALKRLGHTLVGLAAGCALAVLAPTVALAATPITTTIANPAETTVNLFDYGVTGAPTDKDTGSLWVGNRNNGINAGHLLKFFNGGIDFWNAPNHGNNGASVTPNIVKSTLEDGYPVLSGRYSATNEVGSGVDPHESLAYLFNPDSSYDSKYRTTYADVDGLFQVDPNDGSYYYDSSQNFASLNKDGKNFTVYSEPSKTTNGGAPKGQFFPFNSAADMVDNGNIKVNNDKIDHWFGLSMTTSFSQPANGQVYNQNGEYVPMQYHFSGDDDAWVFIDGVLVGDLGGTHEALGLDINFQTGDVNVNGNKTNLKALYDKAGRTSATEWKGNTFADGSNHTLNFFYLERGGWESDLKIKYNLISTSDYSAHKALLKSATNQAPLQDGQFSFELTGSANADGTGAIDRAFIPAATDHSTVDTSDGTLHITATNSAEGDVNFGNLHLNDGAKLDGKTAYFKVRETSTSGGGIVADGQTYYFKGTFVQEDGHWKLKKTYYTDATYETPATDVNFASFVNSYDVDAQPIAVTGTKTISGGDPARGFKDGDAFTFNVSVDNNGPLPSNADENGNITINPKSGSSAPINFGDLKYSLADAGKTFTYTVKESGGTLPAGVSADTTVKTFSVHVEKVTTDATVSLETTVTDANGKTLDADGLKALLTFNNTYTANPATVSGEGTLAGTKTLTVTNSDKKLAAGDFTFVAKQTKGDTVTPSNGLTVTNGANGDAGAYDFGSLTFSKVGTYTYEVAEQNDGKTGFTYDNTTYTVTFTVSDPGTGTLQVDRTVTSTSDKADLSFTNSYAPEPATTVALGGVKAVTASTGNEYKGGLDKFSFKLKDSDGKVVDTVAADANGKYSFGTLDLTTVGDHTYTVSEVKGNEPGVSYDGATYTVTFTVEDEGGQLKVTDTKVTGGSSTSADALNFTNAYDPASVSWTPSGTKVLNTTEGTGAARAITDNEFSFTITGDDGTNETVTNKGNGFTFSPITYTQVGTHTYTITEVKGTDPTIEYDRNSYKVTVDVTDEGGKLATKVTGGESVAFTNTYTPSAATVTGSQISGTKTLNGRAAQDGEFTFDLFDSDGNLVDTATNVAAADGEAKGFAFSKDLALDKVGTYTYTVVEENGGKHVDGVDYDDSTFGVTITVTQDTDAHKLVATVSTTKDGADAPIAFVNTYKVDTFTSVSLTANKTLTGKALEAGQFTFKLADGNGYETTGTNDASGKVTFAGIPLEHTGTYAFTISEVNDGQANVTYSDATYRVNVTVVDNGKGALEVTGIEYPDGEPVFANTYTEPPVQTPSDDGSGEPPAETPTDDGSGEPNKELPQTGDTSVSPAALASVGIAAVAAVCAGVVLRRRNSR